MKLPAGYNVREYMPRNEDFAAVLAHKENYSTDKDWWIPYYPKESPYYYKTARIYLAAILLKWNELAKEIEKQLSLGYYDWIGGVKTFHEYLNAEQLAELRQLAIDNKKYYIGAFDLYKNQAWETESPEARVQAKKDARKGIIEVKIKNTGNLLRLIPYSMKYGSDPSKPQTGAKMHVFIGNDIGGKYNIVIRGSNLFGENTLHKIYNQPFFTTEQEARDFIANFDHNHVNTKVTIEDWRWVISDAPIDNGGHYKTDENGEMIKDKDGRPIYEKTPFSPKLEDAVKVDTVCGPAWMLKDLLDDYKDRMAKWKAERKEREKQREAEWAQLQKEQLEDMKPINENIDNPFTLDFEARNAYGERVNEAKENLSFTCCICGEECEGYGNNPEPIKHDGKCCDACNRKFVIPARLLAAMPEEDEE